jgi:phosphate starvation-inducible protein PhoH and related proteins
MAKSANQRRYLDAIEEHDIVFGIGPAGTGKTYLAMAQAVNYLLAKKVSRIILARPAVEAGEKLGFLPGDLQEKVNPYLRPLYDALYDMMDLEKAERLLERGHHRSGADRVHARPDAQRRLRHSGRGPEHHSPSR